MSGTYTAYEDCGGIIPCRLYAVPGTHLSVCMRCPVLTYPFVCGAWYSPIPHYQEQSKASSLDSEAVVVVLSAYVFAMRCPVLTCGTMCPRACCAMSGTDTACRVCVQARNGSLVPAYPYVHSNFGTEAAVWRCQVGASLDTIHDSFDTIRVYLVQTLLCPYAPAVLCPMLRVVQIPALMRSRGTNSGISLRAGSAVSGTDVDGFWCQGLSEVTVQSPTSPKKKSKSMAGTVQRNCYAVPVTDLVQHSWHFVMF